MSECMECAYCIKSLSGNFPYMCGYSKLKLPLGYCNHKNFEKERINDKLPLGIMPKYLHEEKRKKEILDAMERYAKVNLSIPIEWILELKELDKIK